MEETSDTRPWGKVLFHWQSFLLRNECKHSRKSLLFLVFTPVSRIPQQKLCQWKSTFPQGLRITSSCTDQIATLQVIVEQSLEWNSALYINFLDYEKAFDSVDRETLWKLLRHYGIPSKLVSLIKSNYEGVTCRVIHEGQFSRQLRIQTGVRQGCLQSPFLFLLVIDWIMKMTTKQRRNGIQWAWWSQSHDLDFADDLVATYQDQDFQLKCKVSFTLWWRDMEDNKSYRRQSTNLHQQLPPENPESALAR